jgi:hypothetical protein
MGLFDRIQEEAELALAKGEDPTLIAKYGDVALHTDRVVTPTGTFPLDPALSASVETAGEIEGRITATRLVLTGPFALALRKKKDDRELFLYIDAPTGQHVEPCNPKEQGARARLRSADHHGRVPRLASRESIPRGEGLMESGQHVSRRCTPVIGSNASRPDYLGRHGKAEPGARRPVARQVVSLLPGDLGDRCLLDRVGRANPLGDPRLIRIHDQAGLDRILSSASVSRGAASRVRGR